MTNTTPHAASALVEKAVAAKIFDRAQHPIPLVATAYDIRITGGLASVVARRTFRNEEALSIEATLTFPVPVHATVHGLDAKIGGRTLTGLAKAREAARATYEDAIDRGKTAVLHEELLRGIHMLSVGHVAPGTEIEVTLRFAVALAWIGNRAILRIPLTVGDVYGHSGLPDSDELLIGGPVAAAALTVTADSGTPMLLGGGKLDGGSARVPLNAPLVVEVRDWKPTALTGRAADGHAVSLSIAPATTADARIDAAVLVDHSGSMTGSCSGSAPISKHAAVLLGLAEAGRHLTARDSLDLWEFGTLSRHIGKAGAGDWRALIPQLSGPQGGTEIGSAIAAVIASGARDILLITDGMSHALDIQALAKSGARITVVLIGDDSLEANVGHLAALTGGEVFAVEGTDVAPAVTSALASLRAAPATASAADRSETSIATRRAGMAVVTAWSPDADTAPPLDDATQPAVAAYAAGLRIATLDTAEAAKLAEAEGLVTHLTSLYLVDEDGSAQEGLPATRKIPLPQPELMYAIGAPSMSCFTPRVASRSVACEKKISRSPAMRDIASYAPRSRSIEPTLPLGPSTRPVRQTMASKPVSSGPMTPSHGLIPAPPKPPADHRLKDLAGLKHRIDWRSDATRLAGGDLGCLPRDVAAAVERAAHARLVVRAASRLGISAVRLVIGLLALGNTRADRSAKRVVRSIFGASVPAVATALAARLGLTDDTGDGIAAGS